MLDFIKDINLKNRQRQINKQFEKEGLSDDVLDKQVALNMERHKLDKHDGSKKVFEDYVQ